jgi:hypothetical protein
MKKLKIALLVVLAATFILPSCKKGENDPFISLKSRDARITAKWKLTKIEGTESDIQTQGAYTTNESKTVSYNGSTETSTTVTTMTGFPTDTQTATSIYTFELTLDKLGVATYSSTFPPNSYTGNGSWTWGSNSKNKDVLTIELNGTGGSMFSGTYDIDQLKSSELLLKMKTEESTTSTNASETKTTDYTYTLEKQ